MSVSKISLKGLNSDTDQTSGYQLTEAHSTVVMVLRLWQVNRVCVIMKGKMCYPEWIKCTEREIY